MDSVQSMLRMILAVAMGCRTTPNGIRQRSSSAEAVYESMHPMVEVINLHVGADAQHVVVDMASEETAPCSRWQLRDITDATDRRRWEGDQTDRRVFGFFFVVLEPSAGGPDDDAATDDAPATAAADDDAPHDADDTAAAASTAQYVSQSSSGTRPLLSKPFNHSLPLVSVSMSRPSPKTSFRSRDKLRQYGLASECFPPPNPFSTRIT